MNFPSSTWGANRSNVKRRGRPELDEEVREVDIRPDWDRGTTERVGAEPHSWLSCLSKRSKRCRVDLPELLSRHATCCNPGAADPQRFLLCPLSAGLVRGTILEPLWLHPCCSRTNRRWSSSNRFFLQIRFWQWFCFLHRYREKPAFIPLKAIISASQLSQGTKELSPLRLQRSAQCLGRNASLCKQDRSKMRNNLKTLNYFENDSRLKFNLGMCFVVFLPVKEPKLSCDIS